MHNLVDFTVLIGLLSPLGGIAISHVGSFVHVFVNVHL